MTTHPPSPSKLTLRALLAAFTLLATLLIVGCGTDHSGGHSDEPAAPTTGQGNAADAQFVADMTVHHEGAIEMAEIAAERAEHPEIRELAAAIIKAQETEIAEMKTIAGELDAEASGEAGHGGHGLSEEEMGMHMDPAELETADPFDQAFIEMMIPHHEGAVAMAGALLDEGEHPDLRAMATEIIEAQDAEIAQMRKWRAEWYGDAGAASGGHDDAH